MVEKHRTKCCHHRTNVGVVVALVAVRQLRSKCLALVGREYVPHIVAATMASVDPWVGRASHRIQHRTCEISPDINGATLKVGVAFSAMVVALDFSS